jgi:hypothetical protein
MYAEALASAMVEAGASTYILCLEGYLAKVKLGSLQK